MKPDSPVLSLVKALHARVFKSVSDHVPSSQVVEYALTKSDILLLPLYLHAAHQEALRKEIERLRQVYHHQSLQKMENIAAGPPSPSPSPSPKPNTESGAKTEKEKLIDV